MKTTEEKILKDWNSGRFEPVYFFYGEEDFLIERLCDQCLQKGLEEGSEDFNLDVVYGKEIDGAALINLVSAYPMMAERRLVIIKQTQQLSAAAMEMLVKYVRQPLTSTCLVLTAEKIDARKSVYKALLGGACSLESRPLYDNQVPGWISRYTASLQLSIGDEAIRLLQSTAGVSMRQLASEIEKIRLNLGSRNRIEVADVEQVAGANRQFNVFEFCDAVGRRDLKASLLILRQLFLQGEKAVSILAMLSRQFFIFSRIKGLQNRRLSDEELARELKLAPFFVRNYRQQASLYSPEQMTQAFFLLLEADQRLKSGYSKPAMVLELLVFSLGALARENRPELFSAIKG